MLQISAVKAQSFWFVFTVSLFLLVVLTDDESKGSSRQCELNAFESCKKACCGMSYLLDVTNFRSAYPVLAAAFASANLGNSNDDPENVHCLDPAGFLYPGR